MFVCTIQNAGIELLKSSHMAWEATSSWPSSRSADSGDRAQGHVGDDLGLRDTALSDGRHGHPSKLRGEARAFLETSCREAPSTSSSSIQAALQERFDLRVSISQINRVRAALGGSLRPKRQEQGKKRK